MVASIEFRNVTYRYAEQPSSQAVLSNISFTIQSGEFVCLIGRSGCGKTTLLRLLAGLAFPAEGDIRINGRPVTGPGTDRSLVFQSDTLFPWMTARKNVMFGIQQARKLGRREAYRLADSFLEQVGLLDAADKYPYQLSGGMRQRVSIARSLAMDTDILLLDEPFGALDAKLRAELQSLLEALTHNSRQRDRTVLFVTHDIQEAVFLADRVLYMEPGRIAEEISIPLPRPRNAPDGHNAAQVLALRSRLLGLFPQQPTGGETVCGPFCDGS